MKIPNVFRRNKVGTIPDNETEEKLAEEGKTKTGTMGKELGKLDTDEYEEFDKIVAKKGYKVYRDMLYDEQVKFCLTIKKFLILSPGYEIIPFDDSAEAKKQSDFIQYNFENTEVSFENILFQLLTALEYGFSIGEQILEKGDWLGSSLILLKNIKFKFPWDTGMEYDDYGNLIEVKISNDVVKMNKFLLYSYMAQFGNKAGESDLKATYNAYWLKKNAWKIQSRYLERFSSPVVKGHVPAGATTTETNKFFVMINRLTSIVGIILPRTKLGEEFDFEFVETKKTGTEQFIPTIDQCNTRMATGMIIPRLFGATSEKFGSYALGVEQFKIVYKFLSFIASNLANEVINRQLISRLIDYNFPNPLYPKLKFNPLDIELVKEAVEKTRPEYPSDKKDDKDKTDDEKKIDDEKKTDDDEKKADKEPLRVRAKTLNNCPYCNAKIVDVSKDRKRFTCSNGHLWIKRIKQKEIDDRDS